MATVTCKNSVFLHIPKCAGTAIYFSLRKSGLVVFDYNDINLTHATMRELRPQDRKLPQFVAIRHPADWLRSYYAFRWQTGWFKPNVAKSPPQLRKVITKLAGLKTQDFDEYVDYVCGLKTPITRLFKEYLTPRTTILKQECLDAETIRKMEPDFKFSKIESNGTTRLKVDLSEENRQKIWDNEKVFFSQWYSGSGTPRS